MFKVEGGLSAEKIKRPGDFFVASCGGQASDCADHRGIIRLTSGQFAASLISESECFAEKSTCRGGRFIPGVRACRLVAIA